MTQTSTLPGQPVQPLSQAVRYSSDREIDREVARIRELAATDMRQAKADAVTLMQDVLEVIAGGHAQYTYLAAAVLKL